MHSNLTSVAVIGAGPAGLTAAKHLLEHGLAPVVLEASDDLGGQWHSGAEHSGVWEGMRTNTSKTLTAFSDFPPPASLPMFPRAEEIHDYLRAYAERFGVLEHVRTGARVDEVRRVDGRWAVRWTEEGEARSGVFDAVVLASGRFRTPAYPDVPGLRSFDGRLMHAFDYRTRDELRGQRVLVYGNSISGLEIASELALEPSTAVTLACRRGRFVLQKVVAGVPADWQWFTRFGALLGRALPPEALAAGLREQLLAVAGDPARYGAPAPDEDLLATGLSQGQHYLALVAEGRIAPRPEVVAVEGDVVSFADGSRAAFDAIVCATGYELDLPYLDGDVRAVLGVEGPYVDLYQRTLHPDLPGLGVMGQFVLQGPYFPVLELQARWLAGVWSGAIDAPSQEQMRAGIERYRELRPMMRFDLFHALVTGLAEEIGVAPDLTARPALTEALLFGPLAPAQFRLDGPGALPEAEGLLVRAVSEFGGEVAIDAEQVAGLRLVAETLDDDALREAAATVAGDGVAVAA